MDHLAAATKALEGQPDPVGALEHLLRAWRQQQRRPELAALVEALSAKLSAALTPIDPTLGDADYHAAWIVRASGAGLVELDLLTPGLFRGPLGKRVRERFDLLERFADDPRLHAAFGRMITEPPTTAASNFGMWTRVFTMLTAAPDIRLRPVLERRLSSIGGSSRFWPMLNQRCLQLLQVLPERLPEPSAGQREQIAALERLISSLAELGEISRAAPTRGLDAEQHALAAELLSRIYAEPEVIEHRIVWADALTSSGDPRGEFVQLQLTRADADTQPSKRERELLKQHELTWLGELAAVVERKSLRYQRGFPSHAQVMFDSETERAVIGAPAWATLREVDCDEVELLTHPCMRSLRRAGGFGFAQLRQLAEQDGDTSEIETLGPIFVDQLPPFELDHLRVAAAPWLGKLRALWLHLDDRELPREPDAYAWLFETPLGQRLTSFRLSGFPYLGDEDDGVATGALWSRAMRRWSQLQCLRLDLHGVSLELLREPGRMKLRVRTVFDDKPAMVPFEDICSLLREIGPRFDALELVSHASKPMTRSMLSRLSKAARVRDYQHVHAPSDEPGVGYRSWRQQQVLIERQRRSANRRKRSRKQDPNHARPLYRYGTGEATPWLKFRGEVDKLRLWDCRWMEFSADGQQLLLLGRNICGLSAPSLEPRWCLLDQRGAYVTCVDLDRARARLWIGSRNGPVILWDLDSQRALARGRFHRAEVCAVAVVPGSELLFSSDRDGKLHAWVYEPSDDGAATVMRPHASASVDGPAAAMAVNPDGDTLAVLGFSGGVSLRAVDELGRARVIGNVGPRASVLRWAPGGDRLVAGGADGSLVIWDADGTELTRLRVHRGGVNAVAWTPDGRALVSAGERVCVIDRETGGELLSIDPGKAKIGGLAVSADGQVLAVGQHGGVSCWAMGDGGLLGRFPGV